MESLVLGHALLQQPFSIADWWVGLWRANPTAAGLMTWEVVAGDYSRRPVTWDSAFTNTSAIVWVADTDWGNIDYICLLNSQTKAQGNMLIYQSRSNLNIDPGVGVTIPANGLTASVT
jgi:hypothetical protein